MDFTVSADPPHVVEFRKEVGAWLAEQFKGYEHLRWSASWSTREDAEEYKFRRGLAEKLGAKGWLFPLYPKQYGGAELTVDTRWYSKPNCSSTDSTFRTRFTRWRASSHPC
jgi:alkylation response protein AidB-like acyl-CoA dehydrogenase